MRVLIALVALLAGCATSPPQEIPEDPVEVPVPDVSLCPVVRDAGVAIVADFRVIGIDGTLNAIGADFALHDLELVSFEVPVWANDWTRYEGFEHPREPMLRVGGFVPTSMGGLAVLAGQAVSLGTATFRVTGPDPWIENTRNTDHIGDVPAGCRWPR